MVDGALSAFCGTHDRVAGPASVGGAGPLGRPASSVCEFPGGHFYLVDDPRPVIDCILADVGTVLAELRR